MSRQFQIVKSSATGKFYLKVDEPNFFWLTDGESVWELGMGLSTDEDGHIFWTVPKKSEVTPELVREYQKIAKLISQEEAYPNFSRFELVF